MRALLWTVGLLSAVAAAVWLFSRELTPERAQLFVAWLRAKPFAPLIFATLATSIAVVKPTIFIPVSASILFGFWAGFGLTYLSINLAAWIGYLLGLGFGGRLGAGALIERYGSSRGLPKGRWSLASLRLVGFPPAAVVNAGCGLARLPVKEFALGTVMGTLPWSVLAPFFAERIWRSLVG